MASSILIILIVIFISILMISYFLMDYKKSLRKFSGVEANLSSKIVLQSQQISIRNMGLNNYNFLKHNLMESLVVQEDIIL